MEEQQRNTKVSSSPLLLSPLGSSVSSLEALEEYEDEDLLLLSPTEGARMTFEESVEVYRDRISNYFSEDDDDVLLPDSSKSSCYYEELVANDNNPTSSYHIKRTFERLDARHSHSISKLHHVIRENEQSNKSFLLEMTKPVLPVSPIKSPTTPDNTYCEEDDTDASYSKKQNSLPTLYDSNVTRIITQLQDGMRRLDENNPHTLLLLATKEKTEDNSCKDELDLEFFNAIGRKIDQII